jgi:lysophospholipase L1-like esterase
MQQRILSAFFTAVFLLLLSACSEPPPQLPPLSGNAVILAFGDSLTHGNGAGRDESYPAVLQRLTQRRVINAGVPGEQSGEGLSRLPRVLDKYRPQLLVLCHGGNDMLRSKSMQTMQDNLERMVTLSRERGIPVVLLGVPRPAIFGLESAAPYVMLAERLQLPFEGEILPEVLSDTELKSDQIHPNARGYRRMAEALHRLLQESGAL